jgi:hypothetical protein
MLEINLIALSLDNELDIDVKPGTLNLCLPLS